MTEVPPDIIQRWRQSPRDQELLEAAILSLRRSGRPIPPEMLYGRRRMAFRFEARTGMEVSALLPDGTTERRPRTPSRDGLGVRIPEHVAWWARPRRLRDVVGAVADLSEAPQPGLSLEGLRAQDGDLLHAASIPGLRWLSLARNNAITNAGLEHLQSCDQLLWLDLSRCKNVGSPAVLSTLPVLSSLRLEKDFDDGSVGSLGALEKLTELSLYRSRRLTGDGLTGLPGSLRRLVIRECRRLKSAKLTTLGQLPRLGELDLAHHNKLGNEAASALAEARGLQSLNLSGWKKLGDEGLQALADLPEMKVLTASGCPGILGRGLTGADALEELNLAGSRVNDETIRDVLRPRLRRLDLSMCPISTPSLDEIGDLEHLESLTLARGNTPGGMAGDVMADIFSALPFKVLKLSRFSGLTRDGLKRIGAMSGLRELVLDGSLDDAEGGLGALGNLMELETLSLSGVTEIAASDGLGWLRGLQGLRRLALGSFGNGIDDAGMAIIGDLQQLRSLDISGAQLTEAGWRHLKSLEELRVLTLGGVNIDAEGMRCFPRELQLLRLSQGNEVDKKRLRQLCRQCEIQWVG